MNPFAGKTPTERNKMIAAIVLGAVSLFSLYLAFGGSLSSRKPSVKASPSPTPARANGNETAEAPSQEEIFLEWTTTPVAYEPGNFYAPDAGRNIFAFYEPPPPTPYVPPVPVVQPERPIEIKTPTPPPPPPLFVSFVTPQSVYAGSKTFRLEVSGDKFTPESKIFFNGSQLPTTYISPQQLVAEVPANLILGEGPRQITVATPDGSLFSNPMMLNVQAPPRPQFQYIGMIARKRFNNDTAYFLEQGKKTPLGARLNDVVAGRFRLVSISANETVFEDVSLGFRHKVALYRPAPGQGATSSSSGYPNPNSYTPYTPPQQNYEQPQEIPGIPNDIPRYNPPPVQPQNPNEDRKDDVDDDEPPA